MHEIADMKAFVADLERTPAGPDAPLLPDYREQGLAVPPPSKNEEKTR